MNDEKWFQILENIKNKFEVISIDQADVVYENPVTNKESVVGKKEIVVFEDDGGKQQKVERIQKKIVIDKKMHYHKTKSDAIIEQFFSDNEYSDNVRFYQLINNQWVELKTE